MTFVYNIGYHLSKLIAKTFFRYRVIHPERMIENGGLILAVNHTSYFDPPLAGICSQRDVYYLARKTLLKWPILGPLFPDMNVIPVDRDGTDRSALKTIVHKIREGNGVVLFPEGTRSRSGDLQPAQPGLGLIIAKTLCPVLPLRIFGAGDAYPRGAKFPRPVSITTVIGKPLYFSKEETLPSNRETYLRLSQKVMDAIGILRLDEI
jgi:1-acyl-sn-glycerol-3-phosphate acyltransferase